MPIRNVAWVLAGLLCFALMIAPFGIFPAVAVAATIASRADRNSNALYCAVLGCVLGVMCTIVFVYLLGLPLAAVRWPG